MSSLRTLNTHIPWVEILKLLECPVRHLALPARTTCPLCAGHRFSVYEDTISGGSWHYCFDCKSAGDLIELCAKVWECSPTVAVRQLAKHGIAIPEEELTSEKIHQYVSNQPKLRNRMLDFWRQCREFLSRNCTSTMSRLMNQLRLTNSIPLDRWEAGPGNLLGATTRDHVERTFNPYVINRNHCSSRMTLRNRGWHDVLTVAYHDMPGHISGFLFIGRECSNKDRVFRTPQRALGPSMNIKPEAGLASLWTLESSRAVFPEYAIAVDDAFLAVRLQLRNYQTSDRPLPIIAYYDGAKALTRTGWQALEQRKPILWGWSMTPSLVNQAIVSDGLIAITPLPTNTSTVDHFLRHDDARTICKRVIKRARPWREALAAWAAQNPVAVVEDLLIGLEIYNHNMRYLATLSPQIAEAVHIADAPKHIKVGRRTVVEKDGKWWYTRACNNVGTMLLMDGIVRITHEFTENGILHYRGHVLHDGEASPFECTAKALTHQCYSAALILRTAVLRHTNKSIFIDERAGISLAVVARRFHVPEPLASC